jgi:hypothetical protein
VSVEATHRESIAAIVGKLVPLAESVLPTIRPQLQRALHKASARLDERLEIDPAPVLALFRTEAGDVDTAPLCAAAVEKQRAAWRALVAALGEDRPLSIAEFVAPIMRDVTGAMGRLKTGGSGEDDLRAILDGEAAFRTLVIFLEETRAILEAAKPRDALTLRTS